MALLTALTVIRPDLSEENEFLSYASGEGREDCR
jgi:hypothetical protein